MGDGPAANQVIQPWEQELFMGKYVAAWLLGVPAILLVIVYFFFN
jgi:hypothetical protein